MAGPLCQLSLTRSTLARQFHSLKKHRIDRSDSLAIRGLEAAKRLIERTCSELDHARSMSAIQCYSELQGKADGHSVFVCHFRAWQELCSGKLAAIYLDLLKLAFAHKSAFGNDPVKWARKQLHDAEAFVLELVRYWIFLACSGSDPTDPSQWRAPGWLFAIGWIVGVEPQAPPASGVDRRQPLDLVWSQKMMNGRVWVFQQRLNSDFDKLADAMTLKAAQAPPWPDTPPRFQEEHAVKKRTRRSLTQQEKDIADIIRLGTTGSAYCRELDQRHISPPKTWRLADKWPGWETAYKNHADLRKLIQDQKCRIRRVAGIHSKRTRSTRPNE